MRMVDTCRRSRCLPGTGVGEAVKALGPSFNAGGIVLVLVGVLAWTGALAWLGNLPGEHPNSKRKHADLHSVHVDAAHIPRTQRPRMALSLTIQELTAGIGRFASRQQPQGDVAAGTFSGLPPATRSSMIPPTRS
jgi:hypothetical protein